MSTTFHHLAVVTPAPVLPGTPVLKFFGTVAAPQLVVNGSVYYLDGKAYKRIGATGNVTTLAVADTAAWEPVATGSPAAVQATATALGLVKGGGNVSINADGSMTATAAAAATAFGSITGLPSENANLVLALGTKAPLASPAFTGTPTAPTPLSNSSNTQLATTAFVADKLLFPSIATQTALGAVRGNGAGATGNVAVNTDGSLTAPGSTLYTATGQNTNGSLTQKAATDALAAKADLASPPFTGTPTAPTALTGTATTQVATTAFVVTERTTRQTNIAIIHPNGTVINQTSWPDGTNSPEGSQIRISGTFGDAGADYGIPLACSVFIEAGAVLICDRIRPYVPAVLNPSYERITISGPGTLRGRLITYNGNPFRLHISGIRHEGQVVNDSGNNLLVPEMRFFGVVAVPPAGLPYLHTYSRNGSGAGCLYFRYRFSQCRFYISGTSAATGLPANEVPNRLASAFSLDAINYVPNAVQDESDRVNCLLEVVGCTFYGDGTNPVLSSYGGFAVQRFSNNSAVAMAVPYPTSDNGIAAFGVGSGAATDTFAELTPTTGSIALDFNAATVQTLGATGNVTFTTANLAALKTKELYITNNTGAAITLTFPGWSFFPGPAPTTLASSKQAVLTLRALGTTDLTVKAAFVAQA